MREITLEDYKRADRDLEREQARRGFIIHAIVYAVVMIGLIVLNLTVATEFSAPSRRRLARRTTSWASSGSSTSPPASAGRPSAVERPRRAREDATAAGAQSHGPPRG
jgi:hypothetical protein